MRKLSQVNNTTKNDSKSVKFNEDSDSELQEELPGAKGELYKELINKLKLKRLKDTNMSKKEFQEKRLEIKRKVAEITLDGSITSVKA